jgi:hypothetical protein
MFEKWIASLKISVDLAPGLDDLGPGTADMEAGLVDVGLGVKFRPESKVICLRR